MGRGAWMVIVHGLQIVGHDWASHFHSIFAWEALQNGQKVIIKQLSYNFLSEKLFSVIIIMKYMFVC